MSSNSQDFTVNNKKKANAGFAPKEVRDAGQLTDWVKVQSWLQDLTLEVEYLTFRVIAKRIGKIPESMPAVFAMSEDMDEPLTEKDIQDRLRELGDLSNGWRKSDSFPRF